MKSLHNLSKMQIAEKFRWIATQCPHALSEEFLTINILSKISQSDMEGDFLLKYTIPKEDVIEVNL